MLLYTALAHARVRIVKTTFRFLVRAFSSQDAGGRGLLIMSLVHLVIMTTKIHSGKDEKPLVHTAQ